MSKKVALITEIAGQNSALLAELLLSKNYIVHGIKRRSSSSNTALVDHLRSISRIGKQLNAS